MSALYRVNLYNQAGVQVAVFDDWRSLTIEKRLNNFSTHTLSMDAREPKVYLFELDGFVEVQRCIPEMGVDWYTEYIGFHRTPHFNISADGYYIFTSYGRSFEDLLRRAYILYKSGSAIGQNITGTTDDIMKYFVHYNCGALATTANGRIKNHVYPGFTIQAGTSQGPTWSGTRVWKNLLEVLQEMSLSGGIDFNVAHTGGATFQFRTYYPQFGVDRTVTTGVTPHLFSAELGNVSVPTHVHSRTEEATSIVVLGSGEEAARVTRVVQGMDQVDDSPWNDIEVTRDARNEDTTAEMDSVGQAELERLITDVNFTFKIIDTPSSIYGLDFALGDLVTAQLTIRDYDGEVHVLSTDKKITEIQIQVSEGNEDIDFKFGDLEPADPLTAAIGNITRRLRNIEHSGAI